MNNAERRAEELIETWRRDESATPVSLKIAVAEAVREAVAAEQERCARICREYSRGAAIVNESEGPPLDPRHDLELAGDILAARISEGKPAPAWTLDRPRVPGRYAFRQCGRESLYYVRETPDGRLGVYDNDGTLRWHVECCPGQWCGPLEVPL